MKRDADRASASNITRTRSNWMFLMGQSSSSSFLLCSWMMLLLFLSSVTSNPTMSFTKACFVPPASPTVVTKQGPWKSLVATTTMAAKKGSSSTAPNTSKKVQVKLLKHVAGTGQAGQVVLVAPAFFHNKLLPTKSAVIISDQQIQQEQQEKQVNSQKLLELAKALKSKLLQKDKNSEQDVLEEEQEIVFALSSHRAGPSGQLFGSISPQAILQELQRQVPDPYWDDPSAKKNIKLLSLAEASNPSQLVSGDIKHVGDYIISLQLFPELVVLPKIVIRVTASPAE